MFPISKIVTEKSPEKYASYDEYSIMAIVWFAVVLFLRLLLFSSRL